MKGLYNRITDLTSDVDCNNDPINNPICHILKKLNTNMEGLEYIDNYLHRLQEVRHIGYYINWDQFVYDFKKYFKCTEQDVDQVILDLFYAGQYLELCRDYAINKDIPLMVNTQFD